MMPPLSTLNSTRPPLTSRRARSMSKVIVPDFGFGIRPRRPRILPRRPTMPIVSGVARATSKSSQPASIFLTRSSAPTSSAPQPHRLGGGGGAEEDTPPRFDLLDQLLRADPVGPASERLLGLLALGED